MTDVKAIRPLAADDETVLLRRVDYEALVREAEDAADATQIREAEARVGAGEDEYVPIELTKRLMAGAAPVRAWREHRGLSARALASRAGISAAYLSQIETGRKPGSFATMAKLARALGVDMEDLEPWRRENVRPDRDDTRRGCRGHGQGSERPPPRAPSLTRHGTRLLICLEPNTRPCEQSL